jgi:acyl carrier protein
VDEFIIFVSGIMEVKPENLSANTRYNTIPEWDSLMQFRLVAEIEEKYKMEIPIDSIPELLTLKDFHEFILRTKKS